MRLLNHTARGAALPSPELVSRAGRIAVGVACRLADPDRLADAVAGLADQTAYPSVTYWQPASLALGDAGLALCCGVLRQELPDDGWDRIGHRLLTSALSALPGDGVETGLFDGLSGVAAAAWQLGGSSRYLRLRTQVDGLLLPALRRQAAAVRAAAGGLPGAAYDLISGLAGSTLALLARPASEEVDRTLGDLVAALVGLLDQDDMAGLAVPPEHVLPEQRATAPEGWTDCGLAHGVAGVVAVLALFATRPPRVRRPVPPRLHAALRRGADWLVAQARGTRWPRVVLPDGAPGPVTVPGWCYGTPGVARALWLAGRALDEPGYQRLAVTATLAACRPAAIDELRSPGLCHGLAGLLTVTSQFARDTGDPRLAEAAGRVLVELFDRHDPQLPFGFRDVEPAGTAVDNPGLLSGAAGIVLALLAARRPTHVPTWLRLFALA